MPDKEQRRLGVAHGGQEARDVECRLGQGQQVQADQAAHGSIRQHLRKYHALSCTAGMP